MQLEGLKHRVLVVTGGFITGKEKNLFETIRRQFIQLKNAKSNWYEMMVKFIALEPILLFNRALKKSKNVKLQKALSQTSTNESPELTEVILATLLENESIPYDLVSVNDLYSDKSAIKKLNQCDTVFLSTTFFKDFSELIPVIEKLNLPNNKIIVGGPLTQMFDELWPKTEHVDLIVKGYGEFAVRDIANWIKSDFKDDSVFSTEQAYKKNGIVFYEASQPNSTSLDSLQEANWDIVESYHDMTFNKIGYESVRGCPYRCSFCNYPYLFNDKTFRYKSATKIADYWLGLSLKKPDVIINCLDSLFTMPRKRLKELCEILIEKKFTGKWICYARSEDLADLSICHLMQDAGCIQVNIGLESGSEEILKNMNKGCSVQENKKAILNCKSIQLTTVCSLIVGFPGETKDTLDQTFNLLEETKPDFYFLAPFSTRIQNIPILSEKSKEKFGIWVDTNPYSIAPYWSHSSMDCSEVGEHVLRIQRKIMKNKISLNAFCTYTAMDNVSSNDYDELLDLQAKAVTNKNFVFIFFDIAIYFFKNRIQKGLIHDSIITNNSV